MLYATISKYPDGRYHIEITRDQPKEISGTTTVEILNGTDEADLKKRAVDYVKAL